MAADDNGRISVSKDFLKAALLELKLDLIKELATKAEVDVLRDEVANLKEEVDSLKRWRAHLAGVATSAAALAGTAIAIVLHPWH